MPLYEYHCSKCDKHFDVIQKFSDAPLATHEECGGAVERVLSAPAFQFKGSGWYVTDYGKGGSKLGASDGSSDTKSGDKKSGDSKTSEAKTESKSESKPESKGDSKPAAESKPAAKSE